MKKSTLTVILSLFLVQLISTCDCGFKSLLELQKREIEISECIFIGKISELGDDLTFKISVIESLDGGDMQDNIYIGQNWKYCQPYVQEKGTWLVYGVMENGFLKMNVCGLSRAFDKPIAPPSISDKQVNVTKREMTEEEFYSEFWKQQRMDLANEINALRRRRDSLNRN